MMEVCAVLLAGYLIYFTIRYIPHWARRLTQFGVKPLDRYRTVVCEHDDVPEPRFVHWCGTFAVFAVLWVIVGILFLNPRLTEQPFFISMFIIVGPCGYLRRRAQDEMVFRCFCSWCEIGLVFDDEKSFAEYILSAVVDVKAYLGISSTILIEVECIKVAGELSQQEKSTKSKPGYKGFVESAQEQLATQRRDNTDERKTIDVEYSLEKVNELWAFERELSYDEWRMFYGIARRFRQGDKVWLCRHHPGKGSPSDHWHLLIRYQICVAVHVGGISFLSVERVGEPQIAAVTEMLAGNLPQAEVPTERKAEHTDMAASEVRSRTAPPRVEF